MDIKQSLTRTVLSTAMDYISGDPEKNLPKLLSLIESLGWDKNQTELFHKVLDNPEGNWYQFIMSLWRDIDNDVLKTAFRNFALNATLFGGKEQEQNAEKYGCNIPWAILLDPTSACNLHCTGCWAAEYGDKLNLTYEEMDSIVRQANALGCYFFLFSGGEPLVRRDDIIRLCGDHPDCQFTAFTKDMIVDMSFVGMSADKESVFSFEKAGGKIIADLVCFLRRDLARFERLANLVNEHIILFVLAGKGFVLPF